MSRVTTKPVISSVPPPAWLLIAIALLGAATFVSASDTQDITEMSHAAERFARSQAQVEPGQALTVESGQIDRRLRLVPCEHPLETFHPPGGRRLGATTVGVRCESPAPWTIYVPVRVQVLGEVLSFKRPLPRDHVVSSDDLARTQHDLAKLHRGYYTTASDVLGHRLRRSVRADTVLTPDMLEVPLLVNRGQRVSIVGGSGAVQVRVAGEALEDGARGDRIRVRNLSSRKVVQARVIAQATVSPN